MMRLKRRKLWTIVAMANRIVHTVVSLFMKWSLKQNSKKSLSRNSQKKSRNELSFQISSLNIWMLSRLIIYYKIRLYTKTYCLKKIQIGISEESFHDLRPSSRERSPNWSSREIHHGEKPISIYEWLIDH